MAAAKDNTAFASMISIASVLRLIITISSTWRSLITIEGCVHILWIMVIVERRIFMADLIPTPKMSEILLEEFMIPMNLSAYRLAQEIHVPVSRIQDILHDRRKITADTSLRLARFFGVSDRFFLDMQNDIDIRELKSSMAAEIASIHPCQPSAT